MKSLVVKSIYIGFNIILIILIGAFLFVQPEDKVLATTSISKSLSTTKLIETQVKKEEPVVVENTEVVEDPVKEVQKVEQKVVENTAPASVEVADPLAVQTGTMSAYGPDCRGCSGGLACGFNARGGNNIYHDDTYGDLYIVAGDRQYPCGSIVKVSGSKLGDFNAIVLDRGGAIGFNRTFLFDLLFPTESEAAQFGTSHNVTFELVRRGY